MKCKGSTNNGLWGQIIDEVDFFKGSNILGRPQKFGKSILLSFDVTKQMSEKSKWIIYVSIFSPTENRYAKLGQIP